MTRLFDLESVGDRLKHDVNRSGMRPEALVILEQAVQRGELPRGEAARISGLRERTARELVCGMVRDGILGSDTPKAPLSLGFPMDAAETLFPSLFPHT